MLRESEVATGWLLLASVYWWLAECHNRCVTDRPVYSLNCHLQECRHHRCARLRRPTCPLPSSDSTNTSRASATHRNRSPWPRCSPSSRWAVCHIVYWRLLTCGDFINALLSRSGICVSNWTFAILLSHQAPPYVYLLFCMQWSRHDINK